MASTVFNLSLAALGLLFAAIIHLVLNEGLKQRQTKMIKSWMDWLLHGQKNARFLSDDSEKTGGVAKKESCPADYKDLFPPTTRNMLSLAAQHLPDAQRIKSKNGVNHHELRKNLIPFEADFRQCGPSKYTPSGISLEDVEVLDDFPDYAALSGVPLPEPYKNFDITKAKARPYRPFRWAYHQTMCLSPK